MSLETFVNNYQIFPRDRGIFFGDPFSQDRLIDLQELFREDSTRYPEAYLLNITQQHSQMLALLLLYQLYLLSNRLKKENNPYHVASEITYVIYDNSLSVNESDAVLAWQTLCRLVFSSPYFLQLQPTVMGDRLIFCKETRFCVLLAHYTGDIIGLNTAGGLLFLGDVLRPEGRLDEHEFRQLHIHLSRRILSRFASEENKFPGTLFIAVPEYLLGCESYDQRLSLLSSYIKRDTKVLVDSKPDLS
jgi:hypothetical protein